MPDSNAPATIPVQATLFPVVKAFHVRPGQHIMVVAGVAIGVYSGEPNPTVQALLASPPGVPKQRLAKHLRSNPNTEKRVGAQTIVLRKLKEAGGYFSSRDTSWAKDALAADGNRITWARLTVALADLTEKGWVSTEGGIGRHRRGYRLTEAGKAATI